MERIDRWSMREKESTLILKGKFGLIKYMSYLTIKNAFKKILKALNPGVIELSFL